jgi:hypothetical protein
VSKNEVEDLTISRFMTGIGQPWAAIHQSLPAVKGANLPKVKLFGTMVRLQAGLAEFSYPLDQRRQAG